MTSGFTFVYYRSDALSSPISDQWDKHFGFLVCFVLKVFLQENPTKAVGFANFIYLNQLVGKT